MSSSFPKLLAGPIIKYHEIEAQLPSSPQASLDDFSAGFLRFMLGVVKKSLIVDVVAHGADMIFGDTSGHVGFHDAWWGVILFTFQIYFDFSAYSDMAIGIARMLGFRLPENFNMPYISCSITEFWRRWHISLATWIREYLYIPLGGNRAARARRDLNLWLCFLASGLWHGAAWTFRLGRVQRAVPGARQAVPVACPEPAAAGRREPVTFRSSSSAGRCSGVFERRLESSSPRWRSPAFPRTPHLSHA